MRNSFFSGNALQDEPTPIPIYFQWAQIPAERAQTAILQHCFHDYDDDAVLLQLQGPLPDGIVPAKWDVGENAVGYAENHEFDSLGYRREKGYQGMPANGTILNFAGAPTDGRQLQNDVLMLQSQHIDSGMSGAPVLDKQLDKVVGIIAETYDVQGAVVDRDTSFAVDYAVVQMLPDLSEASLEVFLAQPDRPTSSTRSEATPAASLGVKPVALSATPPPNPFDLKRAPKLLDEWVGRGELLQNLDQDWESGDRCITGLIGFGGEGKSSLARQWVDRLMQSGSPQPDGVFWWGFYENLDVEQFFEALLRYLEPTLDLSQYPSSSAKVAYLQTTLHRSRHRYLLVLDGLEVLQHPQGDDYGLFTSVDLKNWLRDFAEATHGSFCLITTRAPLLDLIDYRTYTHREVEHLSANEGVELLQKLGVSGSDPELRQVVQQWGGYALVLSLLGSYLVDHCDGDIQQLPADLAPTAQEAKYDRVSRVLRRYDEALTPAEREFLEGFSTFRLPMPQTALTLLLPSSLKQSSADTRPQQAPPAQEPAGFLATVRRALLPAFLRESESKQPTATAQPAASNPADEATALKIVDCLVKYRILRYNADTATYATHPLIRDHYLKRLEQHPDRAVALHRQIADFYLTTAGDTLRFPTLADLTPLIEAVHHRCQAGDYDKGFRIYRDQIDQGSRWVITSVLGAYETELNLIQDFFPGGDTTQTPQVSSPDHQRFVLNEIGFCLMNLGRLVEAPPFYERSAAGYVSAEHWSAVSVSYQNLAELYASLGDLSASATAAESALTYARRVDDEQQKKREERDSLADQGWAAHLQGNLDAAQPAFQQAEQLEQQIDPDEQYLYSLRGIQHAEHLRRRGDSDYARRIT
ncbi:serine protease, partial [filamentous cyanobacterium CCT1]